MIKKNGTVYRLNTPNTTLVLQADTAQILYYGARLPAGDSFAAVAPLGRRFFSAPGTDDYTEYSVLLEYADGSFASRFAFTRAKVYAEKPELPDLPASYGEGKTLELRYTDAAEKVSLYILCTVFEDSDVIAVSARVANNSRKPLRVRRLMSAQFDFAGTGYEIVTFNGTWGRERHKTERRIGRGIFVNDAKRGASSHERNPFLLLKGAETYGFNLVYSGNHKEIVECNEAGRTRVLAGINDFMFDWTLPAGESFCAPEAVVCCAPDEDALSARMHAFVAEHIVRGKWKRRERPVLFNNWEGTYFNFDAEKIEAMAREAAALGAELFVLDDGWFGHRNDDTSSLGDWADNEEKTGGGLAALAERVRAQGLAFGVWMEPEMISEDSDLYRAHPNFAMKIPGREPFRWRNQLMLNLADERVQNFVVRAVSDVISRSGAAYVKWDYNRGMTDCWGKGIAGGEYFHRYMLGLYRVLRRVQKRFPAVLFEGCASGGGRFDLGMLCFFPQIWTSDDTDARERIAIQAGTSYAYPQSTMGAHVSACPNHQTGNGNPLSARFNVACGGVLGYELDPCALSAAEKGEIAEQIAFYKENRKLLQFGQQYRLEGENAAGYITVAKDRSAAVAAVNALSFSPAEPPVTVRLKGLDPAAVYEVCVRGKETAFTATGALLMSAEIALPLPDAVQAMRENSGSLRSVMLLLKRVRA